MVSLLRSEYVCLHTAPAQVLSNFSAKKTLLAASQVAQRFKALHHGARGVTTDPGSIPGCIAAGHDQETHDAALSRPC